VHSVGDPAVGRLAGSKGPAPRTRMDPTRGRLEAGENGCAMLASCSITNHPAFEGMVIC
jgi:hypothetical protein